MEDEKTEDANHSAPKFNERMFVTRHGNSCNNLIGWKQLWNKKKDPSLSVSGVVTMLLYKSDHIKEHISDVVYVSSCVRTWMTALLLYGRERKTLKLIISPFIKEDGSDYGNMPESMDIQIKKFNNFLTLLKFLERSFIKILVDPIASIVNCSVSVFLNDKILISLNPSELAQFNGIGIDIDKIMIVPAKSNEPTQIRPSLNRTFKSLFDFEYKYSHDGELELYCRTFTSDYGIKNKIQAPQQFSQIDVHGLNEPLQHIEGEEYPVQMRKYYPDGLLRFYAWILTQPKTWPIFVVSHSHLMQDSLKTIQTDKTRDLEKIMGDLPNVLKGNAWTVEFDCKNENGEQYLMPLNFVNGIPKTKSNTVISKNEKLCLQDQSTYGELFFDFNHTQKSHKVKKYLFYEAPKSALKGTVSSLRGMVAGKKRSHRRKKRRTRRIRKRR